MSDLPQLMQAHEDEILQTYYCYLPTWDGPERYKKFLLSPRGRQRMRAYIQLIRLALLGDLHSFFADQADVSRSRALRGYELDGVLDSPVYLKRAVREVMSQRYKGRIEALAELMPDLDRLEIILDQARSIIAKRFLETRDEALAQHNYYLSGLSELIEALDAGAEPAWVLRYASRLIARATDATRCVILVAAEPAPDRPALHVVSDGQATGLADVKAAQRVLTRLSSPLPLAPEATTHVLRERRPREGTCSYFSPVVTRGRVTGVVMVTVAQANELPDHQLHLLTALSRSIAVLLDNISLMHQIAMAGTAPAAGGQPVTSMTVIAKEKQGGVPTRRINCHGGLSDREHQILQLVARGCTNAEIGRRLVIEVNTVKTHLRRMFQRLGARDRAHAVSMAIRDGWLEL